MKLMLTATDFELFFDRQWYEAMQALFDGLEVEAIFEDDRKTGVRVVCLSGQPLEEIGGGDDDCQ